MGKITHGHSCGGRRTRVFNIWHGMIGRCANRNDPHYPEYGGRGITVCDRWSGKGGFENFLADMGPCPEGRSIDRIDNDGSYEPANCRWASASEQNSNRRTTRNLTFNGRTQSLAAWSRETGIPLGSLWTRFVAGWDTTRILTTPAVHNRDKTHCPRGHAYSDTNTRRGAKGRLCRACARDRKKAA